MDGFTFYPFLAHCSVRCIEIQRKDFLWRAALGKGGLIASRAQGAIVMFTPAGEFPLPESFDIFSMYNLFDALWDRGNFWGTVFLCALTAMVNSGKSGNNKLSSITSI